MDTLFSAILRIHNEMNSKFLNINQRIQHNYNYVKRKTIERQKNTNPMTFDAMCKHYKTTANHCFCSENKLISSNLKIDVPCSHRISMGATFQDFPDVFLNLNHQYAKLEFTHEFVNAQETQGNETTTEIDYIIRTIRYFSHYKTINDIKNYVESHYTSNAGFFINNQKVSVIQLIEEGIYHFQKIKKETINTNTSNISNINRVSYRSLSVSK